MTEGARSCPPMTKFHPHHLHHRQGTGWLAVVRRRKHATGLLVLVGVLLVNMLLLMPHLHVHPSVGTASSSSSSSSNSSSHAWHWTGMGGITTTSTAAGQAAGFSAALGATTRSVQQQQQQQQQQQGQKPARPGSSSIASGDFIGVFDTDEDGVLGPKEFQQLVKEACRNERLQLTWLLSVQRLLRLGLGLHPSSSSSRDSSSRHPCTFGGELLDAAGQAVASVTGRRRSPAGARGASRSSRRQQEARGAAAASSVDAVAVARLAGAATVDPESPEGRAAARSASLLSNCSYLTLELAQAAASKGTLLLTAADWSMFQLFGVNWLSHVQRGGMDNYLVVALDQRTANFLISSKQGHCVLWSSAARLADRGRGQLPTPTAAPYEPGSQAHKVASWSKLAVASVLMSWGFDVIVSDVDTVWLTDPLPYLLSHVPAAADVVMAVDAPANRSSMASTDPGLLPHPAPISSSTNPAVSYLKCTDAGQGAVAAWLEVYQQQLEASGGDGGSGAAGEGGSQLQFPAQVVQSWLEQPGAVAHPSEPATLLVVGRGRLASALLGRSSRRRRAAVGLFSPVMVANSYSWFVQGVGSKAAAVVARTSSGAAPGRKLPLAVHLARSDSSREGRLHQMRDAMWYADGPRYYSDPRLMTYNVTPFSHPDITSNLINSPAYSSAQLLQLHLASLRHQLSHFYAAAAVAVVLGRTLVLPHFSCYCYRDPASGPQGPSSRSAAGGGGWSCRAPGDDVSTMPFACTLEQVLSPALLYSHGPVAAGRPLQFREASLLQNPRCPSWIRHAATRISSGHPVGCLAATLPPAANVSSKCAQVLPGKPPPGINQQVVISAGFLDEDLVRTLGPFATAKLLHFADVATVFGGFKNTAHKAEFETWLDQVVQPWCCRPSPATPSAGAAETVHPSSAAVEAATAVGGNMMTSAELPTAIPGWSFVAFQARSVAR